MHQIIPGVTRESVTISLLVLVSFPRALPDFACEPQEGPSSLILSAKKPSGPTFAALFEVPGGFGAAVYSQPESYFQCGASARAIVDENIRDNEFSLASVLSIKSRSPFGFSFFFLGRPKQLINDRDHRRGETRRQ